MNASEDVKPGDLPAKLVNYDPGGQRYQGFQ